MLLDSIPTVEDCNTRPGAFREMPDHVHAELAAAFPDVEPTTEQLDAEYARNLTGIRPANWHDDGPRPTSPAAIFPEVPTWTDAQLIVAIELCERREPGLNLHAVGNVPDRHDAFLHECSAELVRRLEARGVRLAA